MTELLIYGKQTYTDEFNRSYLELTNKSYRELDQLCNSDGYSPFTDRERHIIRLKGGLIEYDEHFVAINVKVKLFAFVKNESPVQGSSVSLVKVVSSLAKLSKE